MRANIHPQWYPEAKITCACGASFIAGSTRPEISVEICSNCHPFFTGEQKFVDIQGRVEKFQTRQQAMIGKTYISKKQKIKLQKLQEQKEERPKTLREMLSESK